MSDESSLEGELFKLMKEYEKPIGHDFSLDELFEKIDIYNFYDYFNDTADIDPILYSDKFKRLQNLKRRVKDVLPQFELGLINRLIEEGVNKYFIAGFTLDKKLIVSFLTTLGAELYCRENPEKFYIIPDDLDYVGISAERVEVRARKVGDNCGYFAEDSEFEVERAGYHFLTFANNCVGGAEIVEPFAGVGARWTTITTKKAGVCFLDLSKNCKGFVEEWLGAAGADSSDTYINGIEVGPEGLSMEDFKFKPRG